MEPESKIWTKVELGPKINNFGSATLLSSTSAELSATSAELSASATSAELSATEC